MKLLSKLEANEEDVIFVIVHVSDYVGKRDKLIAVDEVERKLYFDLWLSGVGIPA